MMDGQGRNLLLAAILSLALIISWSVLFPTEDPPGSRPIAEGQTTGIPAPAEELDDVASVPNTAAAAGQEAGTRLPETSRRIRIETPQLAGSLALKGGRIDDLSLVRYRETLDTDSDRVALLSPQGGPDPYYAIYGWAASAAFGPTPGPNTEWTLASGTELTPQTSITLSWDNGSGLRFERHIGVDEEFLFTITQRVFNRSTSPVSLVPYGVVARHGEPDTTGFYILHEGGIGMFDGQLVELDYDDITDLPALPGEGGPTRKDTIAGNGWLGFTDKYWMTALIPAAGQPFTAAFKAPQRRTGTVYQADFRLPSVTVPAGGSAEAQTYLFSGAKVVNTIRGYQEMLNFDRFEDAVDWGWFFFLTKPIFRLLDWVNQSVGNMGYAILLLTLMVKAALFPLAYKSYASMARMKHLQPEMMAIKERAGDDRQRMQKEMMELYRKEKVNPAAGCLPILLQIPIFFALYKVLFVTIEMRHAPFVGWIRDLAAPDPTSVFNLFGLIPWTPPEFLGIGFWPVLMGLTMWFQMKLNPTPTDPIQQKIFTWMPVIFTFMLGRFPAGLVIYWTANNILTAIQQYSIMRLQGVDVDFLGNIRSSFRRISRRSGD